MPTSCIVHIPRFVLAIAVRPSNSPTMPTDFKTKSGDGSLEQATPRNSNEHVTTHKGNAASSMDPERRRQVEKSLKRKLDARCSLFVLIYIMNYLDRNNIAAARLGGLEEDLGIDSTQYATCLSILYVGYILMQVPSNIIINRISRPSWYISAAMLVWGLISTLSGNVHNFAGMVSVRFFIGFVSDSDPRTNPPGSCI